MRTSARALGALAAVGVASASVLGSCADDPVDDGPAPTESTETTLDPASREGHSDEGGSGGSGPVPGDPPGGGTEGGGGPASDSGDGTGGR